MLSVSCRRLVRTKASWPRWGELDPVEEDNDLGRVELNSHADLSIGVPRRRTRSSRREGSPCRRRHGRAGKEVRAAASAVAAPPMSARAGGGRCRGRRWWKRRRHGGRGQRRGGRGKGDGEWRPRGKSAERGARYGERDDERPCIASPLDRVLMRFFIFLPNQVYLAHLLEML